jgi:hypothetical protein
VVQNFSSPFPNPRNVIEESWKEIKEVMNLLRHGLEPSAGQPHQGPVGDRARATNNGLLGAHGEGGGRFEETSSMIPQGLADDKHESQAVESPHPVRGIQWAMRRVEEE